MSRKSLLLFLLAMIFSNFLIKASDDSDDSTNTSIDAYEHKESEYENTFEQNIKDNSDTSTSNNNNNGDSYDHKEENTKGNSYTGTNNNNNNNKPQDNPDECNISHFVSEVSSRLISKKHNNQEKVEGGISLLLSQYKKNVLALNIFTQKLNKHLKERNKIEDAMDDLIEKNQEGIEDKLDALQENKQGKGISIKDKKSIRKSIKNQNKAMRKYVKNEWKFMRKIKQEMMEKSEKSAVQFAEIEKRHLANYCNLSLMMRDQGFDLKEKEYQRNNFMKKEHKIKDEKIENISNTHTKYKEEMKLKLNEANTEIANLRKKLKEESDRNGVLDNDIKGLKNDTIKKLKKEIKDLKKDDEENKKTIENLEEYKEYLEDKIKECQEKSEKLLDKVAAKVKIEEATIGGWGRTGNPEEPKFINILAKNKEQVTWQRINGKVIVSMRLILESDIRNFIENPLPEVKSFNDYKK